MRFQRIRIAAFGPLTSVDTGPDPLARMVVVQAPNEGGKSSFFRALSTVLYGFYPASRDRHPYAPWSGNDAEIEAHLTGHDGHEIVVHRRLLSSPWGRVTRGDEVSDIANRTLSWAGHVRRELFGSVFALTLGDLTRVDDESWEEIQDRLLGAMGAEDLRSSRTVVEELDSAAASLWRDDRLGRPESRELQERLRALDEERRDAKERDRRTREVARELDTLRSRLEAATEERQGVEAVVERAQTLGPVRSELLRIEEAEERAGKLQALQDLPPRPAERIHELEASVRELRSEIDAQAARAEALEERAGALGETDRRLLESETRIRALGTMAGEVTAARRRVPVLDERRANLDRRCREAARQLFTEPWEAVDEDRVREIPAGELRSRMRRHRALRADASELQARLATLRERAPSEPGSPVPPAGAVLAIAGLAVLLWGLLIAGDGTTIIPVLVGLLILIPGLLWTAIRIAESVLQRRSRDGHRREMEDVARRSREARRRAEEAAREVRGILEGLPVVDELVESPNPELSHLLGELQGHLETGDEIRREREQLIRLADEAEGRLREVTETMETEFPEGFLAAVAALQARLEEAGDREADARAAAESLEEARRTLEGLREREGREASRLGRLRDRLTELGDGDLDRGLERAGERLRARERARTFREDLERRHPDLDELRRRIREAETDGEAWAVDEEAVIRAQDRARELNELEKELIAEIHDREAELRELESRTTLDRVEGEILQIRNALERTRQRRDRLAVLSRVLRVADQRFRDRNQPDLLRTAGRYLETITEGRYRRLLMREGGMSGTLYLEGPGYPHPVEVATPVSTGTREQVYLALRLAVIDHLDAGNERLPLFLDEAFVNWDARRRERAFSVLSELARDRQLFVFTCHDPMARELAEVGGHLIRLAGPE